MSTEKTHVVVLGGGVATIGLDGSGAPYCVEYPDAAWTGGSFAAHEALILDAVRSHTGQDVQWVEGEAWVSCEDDGSGEPRSARNVTVAEPEDEADPADAGRTCADEDYQDAQTAGVAWTAPASLPPHTSSVLGERYQGADYEAAAAAYLERCRELAATRIDVRIAAIDVSDLGRNDWSAFAARAAAVDERAGVLATMHTDCADGNTPDVSEWPALAAYEWRRYEAAGCPDPAEWWHGQYDATGDETDEG